ncbi:MAG: DUF1385 domain-containing protein [Anaerosomatales bacterium]|nr:DUF1385 domain-containing protein [Anaerosomatales bacterium]MDT8434743.1 DUF1385 domain-containing protein [Anaerosomatales bacterium]
MPVKHTHIGGQAVLEGVMMRGRHNWAVAIRKPDGEIHVEEHELRTAVSKHPNLGKPVIRGVVGLYESLVLAMKAFAISAEYAGETEEEQLSSKEIALSMVLGIGLAVVLFIVLPAVLTNFMVGQATERPFTWNVVDGVLRVAAFFIYIWAISRIKDIQRVFAYHGAEHKTIHAYERGLPLDAEIIQRYQTMHVRCGTSFLLMVMVIAILVFSLIPVKAVTGLLGTDHRIITLLVAISFRILLLPLIAGLAYEVIKWAGKAPDNPVVKVVLWPGLQLQRMTTREPDDSMVEVAVVAMNAVIACEEREAALARGKAAPPVGMCGGDPSSGDLAPDEVEPVILS